MKYLVPICLVLLAAIGLPNVSADIIVDIPGYGSEEVTLDPPAQPYPEVSRENHSGSGDMVAILQQPVSQRRIAVYIETPSSYGGYDSNYGYGGYGSDGIDWGGFRFDYGSGGYGGGYGYGINYPELAGTIHKRLQVNGPKAGMVFVARGPSYERILREQNLYGIREDTRAQAFEALGATDNLEVVLQAEVRRTGFALQGDFGDISGVAQNELIAEVTLMGTLVDTTTSQIYPLAITGSKRARIENLQASVDGFGGFGFFGKSFQFSKTNLSQHLLRLAAEDAADQLIEHLAQIYTFQP